MGRSLKSRLFRFLPAVLLICSIFAACERTTDDDAYLSSSINTSQMMEDLDYFWAYMESEYPLYNELAQLTDIEAIKSMYNVQVSQCRTNNGFSRHMDEQISTIYNFRPFGQLKVLSMLDYDSMSVLYKGCDLWSMPLDDEDIRSHYMFTTEEMDPYDQYSHSVRLRMEISAKENFSNNIETRVIEEGRTAVIRIDSFDYLYGGGMPEQINEIKEIYRQSFKELFEMFKDYSDVIFDITDNAGGYPEFWEDMIVRPNIDKAYEWDTLSLYKSGAINDESLARMKRSGIISVHDLSELPDMPELNDAAPELFDSYISHMCVLEPDESTAPILKGKIWVLTDDSTTLEADRFAAFCKATGFAELAGRQTGGGGISLPNYFVLPHSKLVIRAELGYGLNDSGSCNSYIGTIPDHISDADEYPLDTCLRLISGK